MANLCIKTPSSASLLLIFQLLVLRPRPNGDRLEIANIFSVLLLVKMTKTTSVCDQGDSGGPFTVKNSGTNKHDLVGVVSWGDGCAAVKMLIVG